MSTAISIITPAYCSQNTIVRAAQSVLVQTHANWEFIIVADDMVDYESVLGRAGIKDTRIRHLSTGAKGSGSPPARNLGIEAARHNYLATLDGDDLLHPEKLVRAVAVLPTHGLVSCALQVVGADLSPLRTVGAGPNRLLSASDYKFTNISMDSMLVYDRRKADPRFDPDFPCLTDIEFLLKLFEKFPACYHLGAPLHTYVKQAESISNKPGASVQIAQTKRRLLKLLANGDYPLADPNGVAGMQKFYRISLKAEEVYEQRLAETPGLLFEDHLEPFLKAEAGDNS